MVAHDPARGLVLMRDLQARSLADCADLGLYERAAQRYGEFQRALIGDLPELSRFPTARLANHLDPLLASLPTLAPALGPEQTGRLRASAARLRAMCAPLAACGLPDTVEHGDLWPTNVAVREGGLAFFDFSDATVTHLHFSLRLFLTPCQTPSQTSLRPPPLTSPLVRRGGRGGTGAGRTPLAFWLPCTRRCCTPSASCPPWR